jgi:alcohol dehydrogenase class IV
MSFEFATAARIIFGAGARREVAELAAQSGQHALVVIGQSADRSVPLLASLEASGVETTTYGVAGEPTTETAASATASARAAGCDQVIGFGGGSVIDVGKAVAALLTNGGEPLDYLEVIGRGRKLTKRAAPFIAVPTTAGTGAEVTRNAVLFSAEHRVKVSLRSPLMWPSIAVVDPELTHSMPPHVTASTGLDALTQVLEPLVSTGANPMTDSLCREGLQRAGRALRRVYHDGTDAQAREDMAWVSLMGGLALANAGLGAVHGFAGPLGGMFGGAHGAICAALLPHVMRANVSALRARMADSPALSRYDEVAQLLSGDQAARATDGVHWVEQLCAELAVPGLSTIGLREQDLPDAVAKARRASSMKPNPVELTDDELTEILRQAL